MTSIGAFAKTAISNPAVPPSLSWSGNYNGPFRRHIADTQGARWPGPLWEPAGKIGSDSRPAAAYKKPAIISGTRISVVYRRTPTAPIGRQCATMTTTTTPPHLAGALTISEFCDRFGICRETCYREIRAGRLCARKLGRRTVLLAPDVHAWAASLPELRTGDREQASR